MEIAELVCTPNVLLLENIMVWSSKNYHGPFRYSDQEVLTQMEEDKLVWLLDSMQSSDSSARMRAAEVLRALTKFRKSHRIYLGEYTRFIETMLNALLQKEETKNSYEEDLYLTMLHVAMHEPNRNALGESNTLVLSLMNGLEPEKIEVIRNTCLSGLSMLASMDSNHEKLGGLGLVKWFLNILKRREDDIMTKNAVRGLLHLCETETNVERFIKEGGVKVFADHISSGKLLLVNNMLSMLVVITKSAKDSVIWRKANGIKLMASVLRNRECALKVKACCIHILENLCLMDPESLRPIRVDTELRACISQLGLCKNMSIQTKALHIIHMMYN
ncbi:putative armadillo-like helical protein [Helianthus annuus]|nr:putative armadillo-like helical protein [Helianthus annuus]KAJ0597118.1 putative armadillo-like helical protein [Helianthus annuus]KAJ0757795.1 putative armadillo-like helical protein [Helianthus annuus]KAJ0761470.1 putative armadillo-like helical protein [Helianthus annuus]KAJ0954008.1 putative armadillo-like helical protein [Helianthus annuus]